MNEPVRMDDRAAALIGINKLTMGSQQSSQRKNLISKSVLHRVLIYQRWTITMKNLRKSQSQLLKILIHIMHLNPVQNVVHKQLITRTKVTISLHSSKFLQPVKISFLLVSSSTLSRSVSGTICSFMIQGSISQNASRIESKERNSKQI